MMVFSKEKEANNISIYDKLPINVLTSFYYEIKSNIERGLLSDIMINELDLIHTAAKRRGIILYGRFTHLNLQKNNNELRSRFTV